MRLSSSIRGVLAMLGLSLLMTGCTRAVVTTDIQKDGTWKRVVKLYGVASTSSPLGGAGGPMAGMSLDKQFVLPKGEGWKTSRKIEGSDKKKNPAEANPFDTGSEVYTAERTLKAGESLDHDVSLKSDEGAKSSVVETNTVTVKQLSPTRFEYTEIVRWKGAKPDQGMFADLPVNDKNFPDSIKSMIPANLLTPANQKSLDANLSKAMWQLLFGPNDPLFTDIFSIILSPDTIERKLKRKFYYTFDRALKETFQSQLSDEQRHTIVKKMTLAGVDDFKKGSEKQKSVGTGMLGGGGGKSNDIAGFTSMTFSLHVPGKVLESNGEYDPVSQEVYWNFYSPAPMMGDVVLRVVCEVNP